MEYNGWTEEGLLQFSESLANEYNEGKIKFPTHLSGGNEKELLEIFKSYNITKDDYILSTWRNHWHWLLSGRDAEKLVEFIYEGNSMHVYDKKFITSAIVAGIPSIAVGLGAALKKKGSFDRVFCFIGDGASYCGITLESIRYVNGHDLPVYFIIEDNELGVNAKTHEMWGSNIDAHRHIYHYERKYPHAGSGTYKMF